MKSKVLLTYFFFASLALAEENVQEAFKLPQKTEVLQKDMLQFQRVEWLDWFLEKSPAETEAMLRKWLVETASQTEKISPLFFKKSLNLMTESKQNLDEKEILAAITIYTRSNATTRLELLLTMSAFLQKNLSLTVTLLDSLKPEQMVFICPVLAKIKHPDVIRWLMNVTHQHQDIKVRMIGEQTLDEMLQIAK